MATSSHVWLLFLLATANISCTQGVDSSKATVAEIRPDGELSGPALALKASLAHVEREQHVQTMDSIRERLKANRNLMRREAVGIQESEEEDEDALADAAAWNRQERNREPETVTIAPSPPGPTGSGSDPDVPAFQIVTAATTTEASTTAAKTTTVAPYSPYGATQPAEGANITIRGAATTTEKLNLNYNTTLEEVSGVAMCENRGLDQNQCLWFGCCKWTSTGCKSSVGWNECRVDASGTQMCEGQNFNARQCHFIGCCVFNHTAPYNESCKSAVGDDSCVRIRVVPPPAPAPVPLPSSISIPSPPPVPARVGYEYAAPIGVGNGGLSGPKIGGFNPMDPSDIAGLSDAQSPNMATETDYQGTAVIKLEDGSVAPEAAAQDDQHDDTLIIKQPTFQLQAPSDIDVLSNMPAIGTMAGGKVPAGPSAAGSMGAFGPVLPAPPLPEMGPGGVPILSSTETETETSVDASGNVESSSDAGSTASNSTEISKSTKEQPQKQQEKVSSTSLFVVILTGVAICCGCQAVCLVVAFFYYRSVNRAKPFHDFYTATGKEIPPEWHEDEDIAVDHEHDEDLEDDMDEEHAEGKETKVPQQG